ncbi:MAG: CPBP family intramembrane metalloprotease [Candidatus Hydrogenedentes bacterium]|nr:CPBP family intramembrane metalloprotease [Candidatus Hydrogenedentota bacterium]
MEQPSLANRSPAAGAPKSVGLPRPTETTWRDLLWAVGVLWAFDLFGGIAVVVAMVASGHPISAGFQPDPAVAVGMSVASYAWTGAVVWYFLCRKHGKGLLDGLALRRLPRKHTAVWAGIGVVAAIGGALAVAPFVEGGSFMANMASSPEGLVAFAVLAVMAPFFEEVYYRGFLFPHFRRKLGFLAATAIVSVWFCVPHVAQLLGGDEAGLVQIGAMGLFWTVLRHVSGSLTPCIVCHLTYNATLVAMMSLAAAAAGG